MLKTLVQREIEGKPLQKQLVSAIIPGTNVAVPNGQDIGGDFKSVPPCRSATQTGCLVSYVTFRKQRPLLRIAGSETSGTWAVGCMRRPCRPGWRPLLKAVLRVQSQGYRVVTYRSHSASMDKPLGRRN